MSMYKNPAENELGECPHFEEIDDKTLERLFSKVAAVRSEEYDLFSFTHRPMEVFRGTASEGLPVWDEDRIYRQFSEDRVEGNFVVVIEGEVGTGKSELCAYLTHRLRRDDRPILHIDKNDDLMTILSERIPEFYEEHFGEELPGAQKFKNLREDIEKNPETVATNATSGAILNLRRRGYNVEESSEQRNKISNLVAEKLVNQFMERGEYDKKVRFIREEEMEQEDFLQIFAGSVDIEEATQEFNNELWREIRDRYETASLDSILEKVGNRFKDTRPVIVFEDFSIAAVEAKRLSNYMERDKESDNWDFIVAGTRDSTKVLHTQTSEDRFMFFQTNKKDSNSVLFLDEETSVDFIRPYLGYIKSHDGSVQYDREGWDYNLKDAPSDSICAKCGFCDDDFRDLYPFNEQFLRRVYSGLEEDQKSPREYVIAVFDILDEFHYGSAQAPSSAGVLRERIRNTVSVADIVYDEAEEYADLAKWYGEERGSQVAINRKFVEAFGFETEDLPEEITFDDDYVLIDKEEVDNGGGGNGDTCPACGSSNIQTKSNGNVVCGDCGEIIVGTDPLQKKIRTAKDEVDSWIENPDKYPDTNMYIRRGLRDLIKELTDGFKLYEGGDLLYKLSSQKDPFVYSDSNEAPEEDQIVISRKDFRRSDLRQLAEFGVRRHEEPRSADYESQYKRIGVQLAGYSKGWRRRIFETQLEKDDRIYKRDARYEFSDLLLASYATLCLLDDPVRPLSAEDLNERFRDDKSFSVDRRLTSPLKDVLDIGSYSVFETLMQDAEYVESLVREMFGVSASSLDVPAVRRRLQANPPYEVLDKLGRGQIQNIDSRLRFDKGHNVKDFADNMYDVRQTLDDVVDHGFNYDVISYVNDVIAGTDMNEVGSKYENLKVYDSVNTDFLEELGKLCEYTNEDVREVEEAAEIANELWKEDEFQSIAAALISLKLDNMSIVHQFRSVPLVGSSQDSKIGENFKEVSEYYVK
ncbi:hypothetical protein ACEU6E_07100 [Halorutilales archaeon Cl-col2-1]